MTTRIRSRRLAIFGSVALLAGLGAFVGTAGSRAGAAAAAASARHDPFTPACAPVSRGRARCYALIDHRRTDAPTARRTDAPTARNALPLGYGPGALRSAYVLPSAGGAGETVAVVDAYGDPKAETDLARYRSTYGLPACTTADGCFSKLDQAGTAGPYPEGDPGWGVETSLDLDMVSAACPHCHILLVEGNNDSLQSLGEAEDTAVRAGADVVSNSYGAAEYEGIGTAHFYDHPGVAIVASTGDYSYGPPNTPAVFADVIGVGGTSLHRASDKRGWAETAWFGSGSGCSAYIPKPVWQTRTTCSMRSTSDISADADPDPGLAVYDTFGLGAQDGWVTVGGTSASSPFVAGIIGLAGNGSVVGPAYAYHHASDFFDVTKGSNGACDGNYLCTAVKGYDGPTGLGTPDGDAGL